MRFTATITGLGGLQRQFVSASEDMAQIVADELAAGAQEWVSLAAKDAPKDTGQLTGEITVNTMGPFSKEIVANKIYAPFMEFGTKGKYLPIPGTEAIAARFKGFKGTPGKMFQFILLWVRRKGIGGRFSVKTRKRVGSKINQFAEDYAVAWPIFLSILKNGVNPHPFFFKQKEIVWPEMIRNIEKRLKAKTKVSIILPGEVMRPKIITV